MNNRKGATSAMALLGAMALAGCTATAPIAEQRAQLVEHADAALLTFQEVDPTLSHFINEAHGYAVFPRVTRGGLGIGGAHGRGVVYRQAQPVGWCELTQATIGVQLGGQSFSQLIFFGTADAFENFKAGSWALAANASAVAAHHGAAGAADYERGVAVFILPRGGLMFEAAVGGQRFTYEPIQQKQTHGQTEAISLHN